MTEISIVNRLPELPADHVMKLLSMTTCMVGCIFVGLRFKYLSKIPYQGLFGMGLSTIYHYPMAGAK